jgi:hypothetical protein
VSRGSKETKTDLEAAILEEQCKLLRKCDDPMVSSMQTGPVAGKTKAALYVEFVRVKGGIQLRRYLVTRSLSTAFPLYLCNIL